jgi:hypothetical protein
LSVDPINKKKKKTKETFIRSQKDKKLTVKLLLQFTVKNFWVYNDFPTPFNFSYLRGIRGLDYRLTIWIMESISIILTQ